jgi:hypothetical protein
MMMSIYSSTAPSHSTPQTANTPPNHQSNEKSALGLVAALCGLHQKHMMHTPLSFKHNK